jgi:RHS repeat-associated protein
MQLASSARIPDGLLAAMPLGDQKPHQGVSSRNPALYQGPTACNSTTALGLQAAAVLNRVGSCSTGKERDAESGNDYFSARYYASAMGRFLSPDWSAKIEPVPYSKLDNPQTLNLYAYVGNNPLSRVDPTGHADIAAQCQGKPTCNVTLVQTVNIVHQQTDKATGETKTVVDSTLKVTTNFSVTTDAKGNMSASASSTVENVSGHAYSASQLATMGTNIGTMQQAAVGMGFGANTTQLVTGIGAAETRFGTAPNGTSHDWMNPAINPMQAIQKNGANLDRNNNIERGMGVLDWAGTPSNFDPTSTYYRYSNHSDATMSNWQGTYGSITEQQP